MKIIIETKRLFLREFLPEDATALFKLNNDKEVIKYTGDLPFESLEAAQQFLQNYNEYDERGYGRWAVVLKKNKEFIGWCGMKLNEEGLIDLGFRIFKKHWRKGFATEAANASLFYGFQVLAMNEIIGHTAPDNVASLKVLQKIGMKYWKKGECHGIENAGYYRIGKDEYLKSMG